MFKVIKILLLNLALVAIVEGLHEINSKYWLISCSLSACSFAFNSCMNCFGERGCKTCITLSKPECSACADDIYNKNNLETMNGIDYFICDSMDPVQTKVCHFYCRGQYAQSGQCSVENNLPICKCSSQSGSLTTEPQTQQTLTTTTSTTTTATITTTTTTISTRTPSKESTTTASTQTVHFNGTVKQNVSLNGVSFYRRILPLPNGDLVRESDRNFIEIWNIEKGVIKRNLTSGYWYPGVFGLLSNGDLVAGDYQNKTLLVWDLKITNGEPLKRIMHTTEWLAWLTVLKNDDLAIGDYCGANDNYCHIVIRDSQTGTIKNRLVGHKLSVHQIIEMKNGNLVSCSVDGTVKVWNVKSDSIWCSNSITHAYSVNSVALLNNGYLACGLNDGTINVWNLETNQLIRNLTGHTRAICFYNCLQVLDNGDLLSASWDGSLKVWNPNDGTLKFTSNVHRSSVHQLALLPSGNFVSSSDKELIVWN